MKGFSLQMDEQYFENFMHFNGDEVFIDGGGYDGLTSLGFAERYPNYKRIYYFEPMQNMMEISKQKLKRLSRIVYLQKGLYSRRGIMKFDSTASSASRILATGNDAIEVNKLDDEVKEPITFIKLDIEGAEL